MRKQRGNTCERDGCRARCSKNTRGGLGRIRLLRSGMRSKSVYGSSPGLQAKTLFEYLQQREPGRFSDSQVRTLQRRIKNWRALEGPPREVFFAQDHDPGELCQSDSRTAGNCE